MVLVYLGAEVPDYVFANLQYLRKIFPNVDLLLVGDSQDAISRVHIGGVTLLDISKRPYALRNFPELESKSSFRHGFWIKTLARIYALEHIFELDPNESILQVECDVWLAPNFPLSKFDQSPYDIAYPLASKGNGVASTLYLRNLASLQELLHFIDSNLTRGSDLTDVSLLGDFEGSHPSGLGILPTAPNSERVFHKFVSAETVAVMSDSFDIWGGFFDASSHGIHLTGEDPRNAWGFLRLYSHQNDHAICTDEIHYSLVDNALYIETQDGRGPLYSLHIHSKDIRFFKPDQVSKRLALLTELRGNGIRNEFLGLTTIKIWVLTVFYRLRLSLHHVRSHFSRWWEN
jgi:hypothetical protein